MILDIQDTAGSERYNSLCKNYLKSAQGVLLVFDLSLPDTFKELKAKWLQLVKEECLNDPIIIVVGTKGDLVQKKFGEY